MNTREEQAHLTALSPYTVARVNEIECEEMDFYYTDEFRIANDEITLADNNPNAKLAYSFALASSCKLDIFENRVEDTILETKHIPQELAKTGYIQYSKTDISKLIGRLFIVVITNCIQNKNLAILL